MHRPAQWSAAAAVLLAFLVTTAPVLGAQESGHREGEWRFVASPLAGWHFFGPVRASFSAVAGVSDGELQVPAAYGRSVLLIAEPGLRGGRLSAAFTQWFAAKGGVIARATALRFWAGAPHRTYYGGELQWIISVLPLGVRVGAFRPARAEGVERRTLWMADLSVMY